MYDAYSSGTTRIGEINPGVIVGGIDWRNMASSLYCSAFFFAFLFDDGINLLHAYALFI